MTKLKEGLVHIYTGEGKGKTTAALGLALRALGAGFKVCLIQFLKGNAASSETNTLKRLGKKFKIICFKQVHPIFLAKTKREIAKAMLKKRISKDFQEVKKIIFGKKYDIVILDEIINAVNQDFLSEKELLALIDLRPKNVELVLTGRGASQDLKSKADYITEMFLVKHPFCKGKGPRKGIEF